MKSSYDAAGYFSVTLEMHALANQYASESFFEYLLVELRKAHHLLMPERN